MYPGAELRVLCPVYEIAPVSGIGEEPGSGSELLKH